MLRNICVCMVLLFSMLVSACAQHSSDGNDTVNIKCGAYQERLFSEMSRQARLHDDSLLPPALIYPGMEGEDPSRWNDDIFTTLMKGASDFDIYELYSTNPMVFKVIRDHYYTDLSRDEDLMRYFDAMYPDIREWCTYEGEFFGFPAAIYFTEQIMVNEDLAADIGFCPGEIRTIADLVDFCDTWRDINHTAPADGAITVRNYYADYILSRYGRTTGKIDLDTPEFRSILTRCRDLYMSDPIFQRDSEGTLGDIVEDTYPVVLNCHNIVPRVQAYVPVPYPLLDSEDPDTPRHARIAWFLINPYSKNKEQAFKYLAIWAESMKFEDRRRPLIYRDRAFYESNTRYGHGGNNQTNDEIYSQDKFDMAGDLLARMEVEMSFPGYQDVLSILDEYVMDGTKTLDEAIAETRDLLDTIRQEQYLDES